VAPLTWSHAVFLETALMLSEKMNKFSEQK
jgi:hypothetical protein